MERSKHNCAGKPGRKAVKHFALALPAVCLLLPVWTPAGTEHARDCGAWGKSGASVKNTLHSEICRLGRALLQDRLHDSLKEDVRP